MKKALKFGYIFLSLFLVFFFLLLSGGVAAKDNNQQGEFVQGELIVKYKGDSEHFRVVTLPPGKSVKDARDEFQAQANVIYAEPNYIAHAFFVPNDPYYHLQWHLSNPVYGGIHTEAAWNVSDGTGVTVAIVDTGVAYENYSTFKLAPDLAKTSFVPGYNFVKNTTHANDDNSHGTHVTGTVAQSTNNTLGVAGVAFGASIMPIKVLDKSGSGTYANVSNGIIWAADHGAKVVNLSLGGTSSSITLENAVAYAFNKGVTVVAAAGNDAKPALSYPAAYDAYVIAVGATRYDETLAYYSNFGPSVDLVAPGGDVTVDQNNDGYGDGVLQNTFNPNTKNTSDFGYWFFQGTSMAAPHVSGTAALLIAKGVIGPNAVRNVLQSTAKDLGVPGKDNIYGWGRVDAAAAVGATIPSPSPIPSPSLTPTPTPTPTPSPTPSPSPSPTQTPAPTPPSGCQGQCN